MSSIERFRKASIKYSNTNSGTKSTNNGTKRTNSETKNTSTKKSSVERFREATSRVASGSSATKRDNRLNYTKQEVANRQAFKNRVSDFRKQQAVEKQEEAAKREQEATKREQRYTKKYQGKTIGEIDSAIKSNSTDNNERAWLKEHQSDYWGVDDYKRALKKYQITSSEIEPHEKDIEYIRQLGRDKTQSGMEAIFDHLKSIEKVKKEKLDAYSDIDISGLSGDDILNKTYNYHYSKEYDRLSNDNVFSENADKISKATAYVNTNQADPDFAKEYNKWDDSLKRSYADALFAHQTNVENQDTKYLAEREATDTKLADSLRIHGYSQKEIDDVIYRIDLYDSEYDVNKMAESLEQMADSGVAGKIGASVSSVGLNAAGGLGLVDYVSQYALNTIREKDSFTGKKRAINFNSGMAAPSIVAGRAREAVTRDMPWWGNFLYGTAMSMADMGLAAGLGSGVTQVTGFIMGTSAGSQAAYEAKERGGTDEQALGVGILAGIAEEFFESVSLENLKTFQVVENSLEKNGFKNWVKTGVKNIAKQSFTEGSEEVFTTIANTISDALIMGDKSELNTSIAAYRMAGYSDEEATRKAWSDWATNIALDFAGGALSGAIMGAGATVVNAVDTDLYYRGLYGDVQNELVNEGLSQPSDSSAYKTAQKYQSKLDKGRNLSGFQLANQINKNETSFNTDYSDAQRAEMAQRLDKENDSIDDATTNDSDFLNDRDIQDFSETTRQQNDLTSKQALNESNNQRTIDGQEYIQNTNDALYELAGDMAKEKLGITNESTQNQSRAVKTNETVENTNKTETALNQSVEALESKVVLADTGEQVSIKDASNAGDNKLELSDGRVVDSKELSFESYDAEHYYDVLSEIKATKEDVSYITNNYSDENGLALSEYMDGVKQAYEYGYYGINKGEISDSSYAKLLNGDVLTYAYNLGRSAGNNIQRNFYTTNTQQLQSTGGVHFVGNAKAAVKGELRSSSMKVVRAVQKMLGNDIYIYESAVNDAGERVWTNPESKKKETAPNGFFKSSDGSIWIDINAGSSGQGLVLYTMSHELTHFIKQYAPKKFKAYSDFIFDEVYKDGKAKVSELINEKYEEINSDEKYKDLSQKEKKDLAYEEVVCDASEALFKDGNLAGVLRQMQAKDSHLYNKFVDGVKKFIAKIKSLLSGHDVESKGGQIVDSMKEELHKFEAVWMKALEEAGENFKVGYTLQTSNAYKNSIRENFYKEIDNWDRKTVGFSFIIGNTSDALIKAGVPQKQIRIDATKVKKILEKHSGMDMNIIKGIPELLENPIIVANSNTVENRKVVLGELYDNNNKLVIVALELNPRSKNGNTITNIIKIATAQGRSHIQSLLKNNIVYINENKNRVQNWLNVNRLQLPLRSFNLNSNRKLTQENDSVNKKFVNDLFAQKDTAELKQKQLDIIKENNPAENNISTWIRKTEDILTFEEALNSDDYSEYKGEDFDESYPYSVAEKALETGKIMVYSSYPIEQGVFVSPSYMEAQSYAGNGNVYSKSVELKDVAWIDPTQGQYAKVADENKESIKYSTRKKSDSSNDIANYTAKSYNHHGWAKVNGVLTSAELADFQSKVGVKERQKGEWYLDLGNGRYMFAVGENGVNSTLIISDGRFSGPSIDKVYKINLDNETDIEIVRDFIYDTAKKSKWALQSVDIEELFGYELVRAYEKNDYKSFQELSGGQEGSVSKRNIWSDSELQDRGRSNPSTSGSEADIRDSKRSDARTQQEIESIIARENAELKRDNDYLSEMVDILKETYKGFSVPKLAVNRAAGTLRSYAHVKSNADIGEFNTLLKQYYDYITANTNSSIEERLKAAEACADWLLDNAKQGKMELEPQAKEVLDTLRSKKVRLDEKQMREVAHYYDSYNSFRQRFMGTITFAKNAETSLDTLWQELSELYPNQFDKDISTNDMPMELLYITDNLKNTFDNEWYAYSRSMQRQELIQQVYDSYWRTTTLAISSKRISELKYKHAAAMSKLREEHANRENALKDKYKKSREAATDRRNRSEVRRKIVNVANNLNRMLINPTNNRNVPEALKKPVAELMDVINFDTVDANRRLADYDALIAEETNPLKIESYEASKARIKDQGARLADALNDLKNAYAGIKSTESDSSSSMYDENIATLMDNTIYTLNKAKEAMKEATKDGESGETYVALRNLTLSQLNQVYDMLKATLTSIRNINNTFALEKKQKISSLANKTEQELLNNKNSITDMPDFLKEANKFKWQNLKPYYAFKFMGSETLQYLSKQFNKGEAKFATNAYSAKEFCEKIKERYNYDKWDLKKEYSFRSKNGKDFTLTLPQMLTMYAYSKRNQAVQHLEEGGFVFDSSVTKTKGEKGKIKYTIDRSKNYIIDDRVQGEIRRSLTSEQIAFADEMQRYLSNDMADLGNEISLKMYGIKQYNEEYYFPIKSSDLWLRSRNNPEVDTKLKNSGFTKKLEPYAGNPIVLQDFMDIWTSHVNDMCMYNAMVLPLEDFSRVYNYDGKADEDNNIPEAHVKPAIETKFGEDALNYIETLTKQLNKSVRGEENITWQTKAISKFKKAAVVASLSVVIQQPTALPRAFAEIDPKYFVGKKIPKAESGKLWDEMKKYAPVCIIKEMGGFDTNVGASTKEYIAGREYGKNLLSQVKKGYDWAEDKISYLPELADEVTWATIWKAVKRETMASSPAGVDVKSEEFLNKCGERFTEIITKTQVYDSVLSRSQIMRSKSALAQMSTAFMAEPTTSMNMLMDAYYEGKRGDKKKAARIYAAVYTSAILAEVSSALVYALRDDDEDKTFLEKYLSALSSGLIDGVVFLPMTALPIIKDLYSLAIGYDVERSDMSIYSDLFDSIQRLSSENTSGLEKGESLVGSIATLFGVPLKNVIRDAKAVGNFFINLSNNKPESKLGMRKAFEEGIKSQLPFNKLLFKNESNATKLYDAYVTGDEAYKERMLENYKDKSSAINALSGQIKDNYLDGEISSEKAKRYLKDFCEMNDEDIFWKVKSWEDKENLEEGEGYSKFNDFYDAVESGKNLRSTIKMYKEHGYDNKDLASKITSHFKPTYVGLTKAEKTKLKGYLLNAYVELGCNRATMSKKIDSWE